MLMPFRRLSQHCLHMGALRDGEMIAICNFYFPPRFSLWRTPRLAHKEITKDTVSAESEGAGYCLGREVALPLCPVTARCSVGPFVIYLISGSPVDQRPYHGSAHGQRAAVVTGWVGGGHLVAGHRSYGQWDGQWSAGRSVVSGTISGQRDGHTVSGTVSGQRDGQWSVEQSAVSGTVIRSAGRPPVSGTATGQRDGQWSAG